MTALRRHVLAWIGAAALMQPRAGSAGDAGVSDEPPDFDGPLPSPLLGTKPPDDVETRIAQGILARCPSGAPPLAVAQYFEQLSGDVARYKEGWPDRWNPLIVEF